MRLLWMTGQTWAPELLRVFAAQEGKTKREGLIFGQLSPANKKGESPGFAFFNVQVRVVQQILAFHLLQLFSFGFFDVPHHKEYREE